jgi:transcriptional regulator with XRE-family HTH domain
MCSMSEDWDRLARAIYDRRTALGLSRQRLADMAHVSLGSVKNLEKEGRSYERTPASLAPVAEALGWTRESARVVLAGGTATLEAGALDGTGGNQNGYYEVEDNTDAPEDVGMIVRNTVIEVIGVLAPDTPLSEMRQIEARALEAVLRRGGKPRQRHPRAYQDLGPTETTTE